jgi:hypothetical protein
MRAYLHLPNDSSGKTRWSTLQVFKRYSLAARLVDFHTVNPNFETSLFLANISQYRPSSSSAVVELTAQRARGEESTVRCGKIVPSPMLVTNYSTAEVN